MLDKDGVMADSKKLLHVGGGTATKERTTRYFNTDEWVETRLDNVEAVKPDILGSLVTLEGAQDEAYDAVFASHVLQRLYAHEVPEALRNWLRVLKKDGHLVMTCPDLQAVSEKVIEGKLLETLYESSAGPVSALDVLYGFRPQIAAGGTNMANHCGFTLQVLAGELQRAGFGSIWGARNEGAYSLIAIANKEEIKEADLIALADRHIGEAPTKSA